MFFEDDFDSFYLSISFKILSRTQVTDTVCFAKRRKIIKKDETFTFDSALNHFGIMNDWRRYNAEFGFIVFHFGNKS